MKIIKNVLVISLILLIQALIWIYRIISNFWEKYSYNIKNFVKKLDKELRIELQ